jgi:hypothetical protein
MPVKLSTRLLLLIHPLTTKNVGQSNLHEVS